MQHQHEAAHPPPNGADRSTVKVMHRVLCHMGFNDANDIADQKNDQQSARQKIKQNIQPVGADRSRGGYLRKILCGDSRAQAG